MEEQIIMIFCFCDDYFKSKEINDWHNVKLATSEVMLTYVIAMRFFYGSLATARNFFHEHKYIPNAMSPSGLNKRIHKIPNEW